VLNTSLHWGRLRLTGVDQCQRGLAFKDQGTLSKTLGLVSQIQDSLMGVWSFITISHN